MFNIEEWMCVQKIREVHKKDIYYLIYRDTIKTAEKEVNFMIKTLRLSPGAKVLDLGCGFGRHSIELAKKGFKVTGVDISDLIEIARRRARTLGLSKRLKLYRKDIRKLNFKDEFDAVIMMLNTFGLLSDEDNERVVKNISLSLKKGGKFLIDLRNPEKLKKGEVYKKVERVGKLEVYTETIYHPSRKRVVVRRYFLKDGKRREYVVVMRLYTPSEIKKLFSKYGLKVSRFFGDFNGRMYNKNTSPRLIIVGEKT